MRPGRPSNPAPPALPVALALLIAAGAVAPVLGSVPAPYVVEQGDVLVITVYAGGEKQDEFTDAVSVNGSITCPMSGPVQVAGLAIPEIAARVREVLARSYYVDPQVLVSVKEYGGRIYLLGEFKRPGIYPVSDRLTVLSAVALAGGLTDYAAPRKLRLTRVEGGKTRVRPIDLERVMDGKAEDLALRSGDRIDVPRRGF
ncbi:MAG TPA: polysaccharide biosynthesis/export family protein [Candidatus Eisenbacteria bacterium]|jgi:polysaccharide export outer membrane protein